MKVKLLKELPNEIKKHLKLDDDLKVGDIIEISASKARTLCVKHCAALVIDKKATKEQTLKLQHNSKQDQKRTEKFTLRKKEELKNKIDPIERRKKQHVKIKLTVAKVKVKVKD